MNKNAYHSIEQKLGQTSGDLQNTKSKKLSKQSQNYEHCMFSVKNRQSDQIAANIPTDITFVVTCLAIAHHCGPCCEFMT